MTRWTSTSRQAPPPAERAAARTADASACAQILRGKISWPSTISKIGREMVSKLLVANPVARLGNLKRGTRGLREMNFFKPINFTDLEKKSVIKAPHIPAIKNPTDTSNFEEFDDDGGAEWARFNDKSTDLFADFC